MERYFKRRFASTTSSSDNVGSSSSRDVDISRDVDVSRDVDSSKESELQDILANLIADPGLRPQMLDYDPNIRDEVRRAYLQKGPCQPKDHTFPQTDLSGYDRRFNVKWFDEFDWLEYSISKDAAFCLYCYLFKSNFRIGQGCSDAFTEMGFRNWKKKEKIRQHVGHVGSGRLEENKDPNKLGLGAGGAVNAIILLDIFLFPKSISTRGFSKQLFLVVRD
ncbi:zinc finger MYM-type protein 5-like [Prunus avium]|uniref:Zinc finger MYM-type protein 5-like n=1 Tax=Prunus avium TaxID=42229 RepID=A0A6P5TNJ8_PRUAV|nr:zinc finger MYM-type protein 5-like [Prunus avium]